MQKISNNISFKGKYAIYGDKESTSNAVNHILVNKKNNVDFFPITTGNNRLIIVATDEDAITLKSKKQEADFISNIKNALISKNLIKRTENLFNYIFGSSKKVPILIDSELSKIGTRFHTFDFSTGFFSDRTLSTVLYADGTYQKYSSAGNLVEEKFEDGAIRKNNSKGYIIQYPNGTYKQFSSNQKLREEKFEDGSIERYRHAAGRQFLQTKISPPISPDAEPIVRNYLYDSGSLSFITESTGRVAKVDKDGNEIWLDIDSSKIGDGFSEEFIDQTTLVRNYSDGSKDTFKCGVLASTLQTDGTKIFYYRNGQIEKVRKNNGTIENYYENGNLKSIYKGYTRLKEFYEDGKICYELLEDNCSKYYRYSGSESFSYIVKDGVIFTSDGTISEDKKEVVFTKKDGTTISFNYYGLEVKKAKDTKRTKEPKTPKKEEPKEYLPIFVVNSLKVGAILDREKKTVSFLRDNDTIDIYNYDGVLLCRRFPEGDEKEFDSHGQVVAETSPFGTRIDYHRGDFSRHKTVTTPDGIKSVYSWDDRLMAKIYPDGKEYRYNRWGQPEEVILPNRKRGTYHYEPVTNNLLFISYTDNSIVSENGEIDRDNQTVSFLQKDGNRHVYSSNGKLIAIKLKNGITNFLDEDGKLKEKVYPNGTRATYDKKGILISKIFTNGIIEEYNERGVITKITDKTGDVYEYYYGKLIKAPRNILIRNQKQRNLYISARQSLISTIAWKLSPETKAGLSEHAEGDSYLASIIAKKDFNQKLSQALKFSRPVESSEPIEVSKKENIKYLSYLKQSWKDIGVEEFSKAISAAYEIFRQYVEYGIDSIEDLEVREAVREWVQENPDKNNILMYSKK